MSYDNAVARAEAAVFLSAARAHPKVLNVAVAGGARRGEVRVDDVDLVVTAKAVDFPAIRQAVLAYASNHGWSVEPTGPYAATLVMASGCPLDIRFTTLARRGATLLWCTGSIGHNVRLKRRALSLGMHLRPHGLYDRDGALVAALTEDDIYAALGVPVRAPTNRRR